MLLALYVLNCSFSSSVGGMPSIYRICVLIVVLPLSPAPSNNSLMSFFSAFASCLSLTSIESGERRGVRRGDRRMLRGQYTSFRPRVQAVLQHRGESQDDTAKPAHLSCGSEHPPGSSPLTVSSPSLTTRCR